MIRRKISLPTGLCFFSAVDGSCATLLAVASAVSWSLISGLAYQYFSELLEKYPASKYSPDARQRMLNLREVLARSEIAVADFYLRRGANVAAANRGRFILENYPDTEARAEALAVIIEASWKLNLKEEADNALQVLKL